VREVLQEEDEDGERLELTESSAVHDDGGDRNGQQGDDIQGKNAEGAANVEVAQAMALAGAIPQAAGDEKAGECEEEHEADPAGLGQEAEDADGRSGGLEASSVVEDEDEQDGEAAEAVEGDVAAGFGRGGGDERGVFGLRLGGGVS